MTHTPLPPNIPSTKYGQTSTPMAKTDNEEGKLQIRSGETITTVVTEDIVTRRATQRREVALNGHPGKITRWPSSVQVAQDIGQFFLCVPRDTVLMTESEMDLEVGKFMHEFQRFLINCNLG